MPLFGHFSFWAPTRFLEVNHLRYDPYRCQIWGQKQSKILLKQLKRLKQKHCQFAPQELVDKLYKESKTNKLKSIIKTNYWFVYNQLKNNLQETLSNFFNLNTQLHKHYRKKKKTVMVLPPVMVLILLHSHCYTEAIKQWNEIQNFMKIDIYFPKMTYSKFLKSVENYIKSKH